ncbi:MAG: hypothetical protein GY734_03315 [Herbaspirillum sp.]|nr:hypothetical protein [Herbaspirillum sp.]
MSEVTICNQALGWVGVDPITSFDDPGKAARLCKTNYAPIRDAVLSSALWTFATSRMSLPRAATAPVFGYANAYLIPSTVLRIVTVNLLSIEDETSDWQVESIGGKRHIVSNADSCKVKAIVRITDTTQFSALFTQALAARIAADFAIPLTTSRSLFETLMNSYIGKINIASSTDGTQGKQRKMKARWLNRSRQSTMGAGPFV